MRDCLEMAPGAVAARRRFYASAIGQQAREDCYAEAELSFINWRVDKIVSSGALVDLLMDCPGADDVIDALRVASTSLEIHQAQDRLRRLLFERAHQVAVRDWDCGQSDAAIQWLADRGIGR